MTQRATEFQVKTNDEGEPIENLGPGRFDESSQVVDDMPSFEFTAGNPGGVNARILQSGVELDVFREEEKRFPGIVDTVEPVDDQQDSDVQVEGVHVGYKLMQARICDSYDFDEDGDPGTVRDAVTINPWKFIIFREPGGTLDASGNLPALTGVRPDEVYQMLIGTKFIKQIDLQDTRYFLPSTITDATNTKVTVWKDGQDGDVRPSFQFVRNGDNYVTGGTAETIPLVNGDPNIDEMGNISEVTVEAIGVYDSTHDLTVDVCRDAYETTRTYSSVSLSREDNWNGTTFSRWTGTIDLSGGAEAAKNALAAKLGFTPDDGPTSTTSKIYYLRFDATTESDTGITEGTLETYTNPVTFGDGGENWIETDLLTFNRLRACEKVRTMTESDASVNTSPHWDAWIDQDLDFHFSERRGEDITGHEYSFDEGNLDVVRHRFFGGELAFQTIAYGAGSGRAQTRIVSKTEFSNGGLYDSDRDPDNGGDRNHRVMPFVDQNEESATNLLRKARAFHKLHRDPIETFEVEIRSEHVRVFETGDGVKVVNLNTRTDDTLRVVKLTREWGDGGLGEDLATTIGEPRDDFAQALRNAKEGTETLTVRPQPNLGTVGLSGNGFIFDKDHFGVFPFSIPNGAQVERVSLRVETAPWQAQARSAAAGGDHTHTVDVTHPSHSHDVTHPSHSHSLNGVTTAAGGDHRHRMNVVGATESDPSTEYRLVSWRTVDGQSNEVYMEFFTGESDPVDDFETWDASGDHTHDLDGEATQTALGSTETSTAALGTTSAETSDASGDHTHPLDFGIYQFDGDSGDGSGAPVYGKGIKLAVDPTTDANGVPTDFGNERVPQYFGTRTEPAQLEVDITPYLEADANGLIKSGPHKVFFKSEADGNVNPKGLAVVRATPVFEYKDQGD